MFKNGFRRNRGIYTSPRRISRDALDGLPHEKFLRIVGWFHTMVPATLKRKDSAGSYIDQTAQEFENLRCMIDKKLVENDALFQRDEMGDHVHNLNLLLGKLLPVEVLEGAMPPIRDDYRARVSSEAYAAYIGSSSYKALMGCNRVSDSATRLRLLRADYLQLINEVRKLTLLEYHIEETRSYLIKKLRSTLFKLLVAPGTIVLFFLVVRVTMQAANRLAPESSEAGNSFVVAFLGTETDGTALYHTLVLATLLSLAAIAGAVGSFISALLRIAAVPETNEIARSVVALRYSESIRLAPLTGFVFAILLSFIFGGQLLNGTLFPSAGQARWYLVLFSASELAKWLVWAFIVGFAERLMPDMIDRLVVKAGKTMQSAPSASQNNGTKPLIPPAADSGRNGNVPHRLASATTRKRRRARAHAS